MSGWRKVADRISVVVISRNEGNELKRTVENFDDTLPPGGEIIVIDDGSTDGSASTVAKRRGRIKLHRVDGYGVARARNFGARQARGDVIVYADAHLRLEPYWWRPMIPPTKITSSPARQDSCCTATTAASHGILRDGSSSSQARFQLKKLPSAHLR